MKKLIYLVAALALGAVWLAFAGINPAGELAEALMLGKVPFTDLRLGGWLAAALAALSLVLIARWVRSFSEQWLEFRLEQAKKAAAAPEILGKAPEPESRLSKKPRSAGA